MRSYKQDWDYNWVSDFLFVVVQSLSPVRLFATPWTAACQASLSFTISGSLLKLMSIESMMPPTKILKVKVGCWEPCEFRSHFASVSAAFGYSECWNGLLCLGGWEREKGCVCVRNEVLSLTISRPVSCVILHITIREVGNFQPFQWVLLV